MSLGLSFEGNIIFAGCGTCVEYLCSCEELWQKGLYVELHAYQHHVFMDSQFVDDEKRQAIHNALNGVSIESIQAKLQEMIGDKEYRSDGRSGAGFR